ncbi:nephrocystin-1-like isoform X2 [Saccostrea cucullata]|uniref:nephrocystin-1-like isoform X2 n=1 Tax=Saccostrea cuccullata TaxID=36930 RepID=UPI002ED15D25
MGKELGPLAKHQKEVDGQKKLIEKQIKDSNKLLGNSKLKNDEEKLKEQFKGCYEIKLKVEEFIVAANALEEGNEPSKVKGFDNKKKAEITRLEKWQTQLDTQMKKLLPEEKGEEYLKELKGESEEDDEEEDDDEEEEEGEEEEIEEEEVEEEEEEEESEKQDSKKKEKEPAEKAGKKEKKDKEKTEEAAEEEEEEEDDDEEEEEEEEEEDTMKTESKPKAKVTKEEEDEEEDDDDDEEEEEEEGSEEEEEDDEEEEEEETEKKEVDDMEQTTIEGLQFEGLYDYEGKEEGDLSFKQGEILTIINTREDGWWEAENKDGKRGTVPKTFLQMHNKYKHVQQDDEEEEEEDENEEDEEEKIEAKNSHKKGWGSIKRALGETSVTDVLHALGAMPSGFRPSTLGPKFTKDENFTMTNYLAPKLSDSNISYRDLFYIPKESKLRPFSTKMDRIILIQGCKQIPLPGTGVDVVGRHVRMCLFDGHNMLSNIHTVKVTSVDREQKAWSFSSKISDAMDPYLHSEVFIRSNDTSKSTVGILFELCVSYCKTKTKEYGEFSCGWVHLPLVEENGGVISNRSFDLYVNGGTPYEKGVEVDPSISRRRTVQNLSAASSSFMSMLSGNKQPRLNVKVMMPKAEQKAQLDNLPEVLLGNVALLPYYSYYRQILADELLKNRLDYNSTELLHSPVLAVFPKAADQHDLMKVLRDTYISKSKTVKRVEMRDSEFMKNFFKECVLESVYPLMYDVNLKPYRSGNVQIEEERLEEINHFLTKKTERKGILALLLSSEIEFSPLDIKEVAFDVIGPHCLAANSQVAANG